MNEGDYKLYNNTHHAEAEAEHEADAIFESLKGVNQEKPEMKSFTIEFYDTFQGQSHVDGRFINQAAALEWAEAHLLKDAIAYLR